MIVAPQALLTSDAPLPWSVLFAKDSDQDLEFDETMDDDDTADGGGKSPFRSPLVYVLVLMLVAGGVYVWKPDLFAPVMDLIAAPATDSAGESMEAEQPSIGAPAPMPATGAIPAPRFREGQVVSVASSEIPGAIINLTATASGTQPGPPVRQGELLTVLDGAFIENQWIYHVQTKSGASGWIAGDKIKAQS